MLEMLPKLTRLCGIMGSRYPHWVAPYEGNRYSVIFYTTAGDVVTRTTAVFQGNDTLVATTNYKSNWRNILSQQPTLIY